jgi:hypothetical protein
MTDPSGDPTPVDSWAVRDELRAAGFSSQTAAALAFGARIGPDELRHAPWGSPEQRQGLAWELLGVRKLGPKGLAEVIAFREGRDPRTAAASGVCRTVVPLTPEMLQALDAWIAKQPKPCSRSEAIRAFVAGGLHLTNED